MAKEPENLVLELLRGMRTDSKVLGADVGAMKQDMKDLRDEMRTVSRILDDHTLRFDFLDERVEMLREGTLTAIGFAANTARQQTKLEKQVAELSKRVEKLEKAK